MYIYKEYIEIFKINKIEINTKYGSNNLVMVIINFNPDKETSFSLLCRIFTFNLSLKENKLNNLFIEFV